MSRALVFEASDTDASLDLTIVQEGVGGVTGKSPTVALREGNTSDSYLDWNDSTFKTSGWTTRLGSMTEVDADSTNEGHYRRALDLTAISASAGDVYVAEYQVDDGGDVIGADSDVIHVVDNVTDVPTTIEVNAEVDTALADIRLDELISASASPADPMVNSFLDLVLNADGLQAFDRTTDSLEAQGSSIAGLNDLSQADVQTALTAQGYTSGRAPNLDNLDALISSRAAPGASMALTAGAVDDVWDELTAGHTGVGSTGQALIDAAAGGAFPTVAEIADGVWDELLAGHVVVGSTGEALSSAAAGGSAPTAAAIADAVWDEASADHLAAGSMGALQTSGGGGGPSAAAIADAVWDELLAGHTIAGSAGQTLTEIRIEEEEDDFTVEAD